VNEVWYTCLDCGKKFKVRQGSRRRYCDECVLKRESRQAKEKEVMRMREFS